MQIIIYAMPAIALYMVLTWRGALGATGELIPLVASLFALVLLGVLLLALWKWQRKRTIHCRNVVLACILVACFLGSTYLVPAARLADRVTNAIYTKLLIG